MKRSDKIIRAIKTLPVIVATVLIVVWLSWSEEGNKIVTASYQPQSTPDLMLINSASDHYNETGDLQYHLVANQIDHYKKDDLAYLIKPDLTNQQPGLNWHASSLTGEANLKTDKITLNDQVEIVRTTADNQKLTLRASTLTIYPNENYAENDVLTIIHSANSYIETKGFRTDFESGDTLLKSNVRGTHEVQQ